MGHNETKKKPAKKRKVIFYKLALLRIKWLRESAAMPKSEALQ